MTIFCCIIELTNDDLMQLVSPVWTSVTDSTSESDNETSLPEPLTSVYDKQLRGLPSHVLKEKSLETLRSLPQINEKPLSLLPGSNQNTGPGTHTEKAE